MKLSPWTSVYRIADQLSTETGQIDSSDKEIVDLRFAKRIKSLITEQIVIQYQLAYLSTLGGAYHLCNRPHVALVIAWRQELVGRHMGSSTIIIRAKVFQAVNMRLLGQKKRSKMIMKQAYYLLNRSGLENLRSFVTASHGWLERNYGKL